MSEPNPTPNPTEFEKAAEKPGGESLAAEFLSFLAHNKKWWLLPIVLVLFLLGIAIWLAASPVAPFIYTLF
jgi:hypothetical protein